MSRLITNAIRSTSASSDAITLDGSGNATFPANVTCSGTATGFGGGVSDFDRWYLTADLSGNTNPIVNNWSRWTGSGGQGTVTFAAPSSGIWTFPSTGYWHIDWTGKFANTGSQERGCNLYLYGTTNGGSQVFIQEVSVSLHDSGNTTKGESKITYIIDVHDTSQVKVSFAVGYQNASRTLKGHGSYLYSHVAFMKLSET